MKLCFFFLSFGSMAAGVVRCIVWGRAGECSIINRGRAGGEGTESPIKKAQMGSLVMLRISGCVSPSSTRGSSSAPTGSSQRVGLSGWGLPLNPISIMMGRSFCRRFSCLWVSPSFTRFLYNGATGLTPLVGVFRSFLRSLMASKIRGVARI